MASVLMSHVADMDESVTLLKFSAIEAAQSGINQQVTLTPEIKQADSNKDRIFHIGTRSSVKRLIDQLDRMGMNE
ncbi:hypothetical protein Tsubulata_032614 [Turnera subulata]|uniref:Uncharacterized protein n=1 Tax=Turnera subulata TaxID=218843 RepID=A0A9Q0J0Z7_9ROSI|nr:hypothetical protein Tsubulata_032614 [Turnera subulata]